MPKDSYYFSHDSNARNDLKMIRLRRALGMEGYGIYFAIIEILREQEHYQLPLEAVTDLAFELHSSEEKVKTVIMVYDLFVIENDNFFSARLLRSMDEFNSKRQKYIDAGKKGGEASVKHRLSNGQPLKEKENKEKEIKIKSNLEIAFDDFLEMRKKIRKPATERAILMIKKKVWNLANQNEKLAIEILNQSTVNSWQDVYELRIPFRNQSDSGYSSSDITN